MAASPDPTLCVTRRYGRTPPVKGVNGCCHSPHKQWVSIVAENSTGDGTRLRPRPACRHAHVVRPRHLAAHRDEILQVNVMFIFQPAPKKVRQKARKAALNSCSKKGIFADVQTRRSARDSCLGSAANTGVIGYRKGPLMASSDRFEIITSPKGEQTHGSRPWGWRRPPIVTAAQVINNGPKHIVSRQGGYY